jgi:hypothetical protein
MLRHHLANLARNLGAGLRLVLMLPVSRLRFRVDLVQAPAAAGRVRR